MTTPGRIRRKLVKSDLERMNIPEDYWSTKVDLVHESMRPAVERYLYRVPEALSSGAGLIIHGSTGVGKTSIACLVAKEARSWGFTGLFVHIWELREMIRSKIPFSDDMSMVDRARDVDLLVLDDLRHEDIGEKIFSAADAQELVRYRAARRKVTLVTTRLDIRELKSTPMKKFEEILLLFPVIGPDRHRERREVVRSLVFGE